MFLLAFSVAIFDEHTRFTYLETGNAPLLLLLAALSAAIACRHDTMRTHTEEMKMSLYVLKYVDTSN